MKADRIFCFFAKANRGRREEKISPFIVVQSRVEDSHKSRLDSQLKQELCFTMMKPYLWPLCLNKLVEAGEFARQGVLAYSLNDYFLPTERIFLPPQISMDGSAADTLDVSNFYRAQRRNSMKPKKTANQ
jgi:hypothetical protein